MTFSDQERTLDSGIDSGEARGAGARWGSGPVRSSPRRGDLDELDPGQLRAAVAFNQRLDDGSPRLLRVRTFFGLPLVRASDPALAAAVALFQRDAGVAMSGQVDAATGDAMTAAGYATAAWYQDLDARDRLALQAVREAARHPLVDDGDAVRSVIAAVALMQVGGVLALDRGDGKKFGAERLVAYHRDVAAPASDGVLRGVHRLRLAAPWSGVFATWCVRTASGHGAWRGAPGAGHPAFPWIARDDDPALDGLRTGDIAVIRVAAPDAFAARRLAVVISRAGAELACVAGDVDDQAVVREAIGCAELEGYYATVSAASAPRGTDD